MPYFMNFILITELSFTGSSSIVTGETKSILNVVKSVSTHGPVTIRISDFSFSLSIGICLVIDLLCGWTTEMLSWYIKMCMQIILTFSFPALVVAGRQGVPTEAV